MWQRQVKRAEGYRTLLGSDPCSVCEGSEVSTLAEHFFVLRVTLLFCFCALGE